jgi:hypothetical protein
VPLLLLLAALALATLALGAPRFTWANEGVRVEHPRDQALAAFGAALALGAAGVHSERRVLVAAAVLGAIALAGLGAQRLAFRIDAVAEGLHERTLRGQQHLTWAEIEAVEPGAGAVTLRARDGRAVVIATSAFEPDERLRLERTIARRVREATR